MKKTEVLENMLKKQSIGNKNVKKIIKHSKKVRAIALEICDEINNQENVTIICQNDLKLIKIAALFHDVKKYNYKNKKRKKHNKKGAKYIIKHRNDFRKSFNDNKKKYIYLMIRWHKGDGYINKDYSEKEILMIEIVRVADKISKIYKTKRPKKIIKVYSEIEEDIKNLEDKRLKILAENILSEKLFSRLEDLYQSGMIKKKGLKKCCENGLITKIQRKKIQLFSLYH